MSVTGWTLESGRQRGEPGMAKGKKKSAKTPLLIVVLVLLIIVFAGLCVFYFGLKHYLGKTNYVDDSEVTINYGLLTADEDDVEGFTEMETLDAEAAAAFAKEVNVGQNIDIASDGDVYNILLIGSDTRNGWYGNSDSMILASINSQTKTIYMTSFMRDLYANIPNVGIRKLNSAYAVGGGPLLVSTIESNYRIDIDNYASVDFSSMANIIDLVGGVDLEVSTQEAGYINMYLDEQCRLQGLNASDYYVTGGGITHLNGNQAVGFARIRYTSGNDFKRAQRQRIVLEKVAKKAQKANFITLNKIVNEVFPMISTSFSSKQILGFAANALNYNLVSTNGFPYQVTTSETVKNHSGVSFVIPIGLEQNVKQLHQELFNDDSYEASDKVKEIDSDIVYLTDITADNTEAMESTFKGDSLNEGTE